MSEAPDHQENTLSLRGVQTWLGVRSGLFKRVTGHVKAVECLNLDVKRGEALGLLWAPR